MIEIGLFKTTFGNCRKFTTFDSLSGTWGVIQPHQSLSMSFHKSKFIDPSNYNTLANMIEHFTTNYSKLLIIGKEDDIFNENLCNSLLCSWNSSNITHIYIARPSEMAMLALNIEDGVVIHSDGLYCYVVPMVGGWAMHYNTVSFKYGSDHREVNLDRYYEMNSEMIEGVVDLSGQTNLVSTIEDCCNKFGKKIVISGREVLFTKESFAKIGNYVVENRFSVRELAMIGARKLVESDRMDRFWRISE